MDNILLIHHQNIPLEIDSSIEFRGSSDIDKYISTVVLEKIKEFTCEAIFIKDSLSPNYLDFYGLRLAHHIRLTKGLKELPLVILSNLDSHQLNKLSKLARILFTQNIYLIPNTKKAINDIKDRVKLKSVDKKYFLETIEIEKPEQSSNHDIANEWAVYRWSKFLDVNTPAIEKNHAKIVNSLYFKYIKEKYALKNDDEKYEIKPIEKKGKILYIDDEYNRGWLDILKKLLSQSKEIQLECYEGSFENKIKLTQDVKTKIKSSTYDVILLDMRLTETDHKGVNDISSYSGILIADKIKEINSGIQIIMITASAKSKSLEKLYEYDILGYIQKENPYQEQLTTIEDIQKLHTLIERGFERKYLKEVWHVQKEMLKEPVLESNEELQELKSILSRVFDILNSDMEDKEVFAGLTIFKCIEIIIGFYIEERSSRGTNGKMVFEKYWKGSDEKIAVNSIQDKIEAIFDNKFKTTYKSISKDMKAIVVFRNNTIHGGRDHAIKNPTSQNLITWLKMLQEIITQMDKLS